MDPIEMAAVTAAGLAAIGLFRRGTTPASPAGRAVTRAGSSVSSALVDGAEHLPWPLRPLTSNGLRISAAVVVRPTALLADGASTVLETVTHSAPVGEKRPSQDS